MEIRVTRPFIVSFIPGDQYGGPDCFISCLHVLFTEINQIKSVARRLVYVARLGDEGANLLFVCCHLSN